MKLEINMVVSDAKQAAGYYSRIFSATILSKTDLERELNETRMVVGDTEIRVLNENKDYGLVAPTSESVSSMWINLYVNDIKEVCDNAIQNDCIFISPITEFPESNAINAVIKDKFNHVWVINQKM